MKSNVESARLIARDAKKWMRKRVDATHDESTPEDFRLSPYRR